MRKGEESISDIFLLKQNDISINVMSRDLDVAVPNRSWLSKSVKLSFLVVILGRDDE